MGSSKRKRCRRQALFCENEFDYIGWAEYNQWRKVARVEAQKSRLGCKRKGCGWDCLNDCDYPSECYHLYLESLDDDLDSLDNHKSCLVTGGRAQDMPRDHKS